MIIPVERIVNNQHGPLFSLDVQLLGHQSFKAASTLMVAEAVQLQGLQQFGLQKVENEKKRGLEGGAFVWKGSTKRKEVAVVVGIAKKEKKNEVVCHTLL